MTFDKPVPTRIMANKVQERRWIGHFLAKCPTSHPPNESTALHPYERLAGPPSGAFPFGGSAPGTNGQTPAGPSEPPAWWRDSGWRAARSAQTGALSKYDLVDDP